MITELEIKTFLDALGTLGTLTIGSMPASPDVVGTIYSYGGQAPERRFGVSGIGYEKPAFQLVFRGVAFDYTGPRGKAEIALKALMAINPGALGSGVTTVYHSVDPQQSIPFPVQPIDGNNRHYIGFNVYAKKEPS